MMYNILNRQKGKSFMKKIYINENGVRARVAEWRNHNKPTIVCIHGFGSTNHSFIEVGELMREEFNILSIDLPAHGESEAFEREEDYRIPNLIEWLSRVIDSIVDGDFYLMAHSWGGCVAIHYAAAHPQRVKKLMLIDGGYHLKDVGYEYSRGMDFEKAGVVSFCSLEEEIDYYEKDFDGYVFDTWEELLAVEKTQYNRWSDLIEVAARDLMREDEDGKIRFRVNGITARAILKSMAEYPTDAAHDRLTMPILLLQSTLPKGYDEIRQIQVDILKKGTKAQVKRIDATHFIHWDNPEIVAEEADKFFKTV